MRILLATTTEQIEQARRLFEEYAASLSFKLCFQNFQEELATLPGHYAPPSGRLWLAQNDSGDAVGCVALRRLEPSIAEMKRLYVRDNVRGTGLGKRLVLTLIEEAYAMGYELLRLDTTPEMERAIALYQSLGFKQIEPYCHNPVAGALCLELALRRRQEHGS